MHTQGTWKRHIQKGMVQDGMQTSNLPLVTVVVVWQEMDVVLNVWEKKKKVMIFLDNIIGIFSI